MSPAAIEPVPAPTLLGAVCLKRDVAVRMVPGIVLCNTFRNMK